MKLTDAFSYIANAPKNEKSCYFYSHSPLRHQGSSYSELNPRRRKPGVRLRLSR